MSVVVLDDVFIFYPRGCSVIMEPVPWALRSAVGLVTVILRGLLEYIYCLASISQEVILRWLVQPWRGMVGDGEEEPGQTWLE